MATHEKELKPPFSISDVSAITGDSPNALRKLARRGVLRAKKIGQYWFVMSRREVDRFMALDRPEGWPKGRKWSEARRRGKEG